MQIRLPIWNQIRRTKARDGVQRGSRARFPSELLVSQMFIHASNVTVLYLLFACPRKVDVPGAAPFVPLHAICVQSALGNYWEQSALSRHVYGLLTHKKISILG